MKTVRSIYEAKIAAGLSRDPAQENVVVRLDVLAAQLRRASRRASRLLPRTTAPKGVYLWGDVGRGKSMLVATLIDACADTALKRMHFHAFMRDIHLALHEARKSDSPDPMQVATARVTHGLSLLVIDEFEITDIVDAMIVGRVFERALDQGITLVVTSNCAPCDLYRNGLKRDVFMPFIRLMEQRTDVTHLDSETDYRRGYALDPDLYITPESGDVTRRMDTLWESVSDDAEESFQLGRKINLTRKGKAVRGTFDTLCKGALAASDYLDLARHYDLFFLDAVPLIAERDFDAARRFILLIDTLYDEGRVLVIGAGGRPDDLYQSGAFLAEFRRTISRLYEMSGPDWPARTVVS
jgi:cell division protein ZapE